MDAKRCFVVTGIAFFLAADAPRYKTPEALVADYAHAVSRVGSPEGLAFPLARYFACAAFRAGSDAGCAALDRHAPVPHEGYPTCRALYHQGRMIKDAVEGKDAVAACVEFARHQEAGREDADTAAEAAEFCRGLLPHYARGDAAGACDFMRREDGVYGVDPKTDKPLSREACLRDNIFLAGEVGRCAALKDEQEREHCRDKAGLIRALRTGRPAPAAGTMYAPLADPAAACAGPARRALKTYDSFITGRKDDEQVAMEDGI
ncbi:MAG: hypothetical protein ABIJ96_18175 [Elusimicrobiota bacterium]